MGQTLTHGVYLPDEGERNCYNGLAANWQLLDSSVGTIAEHTTALAGKAPAVHTHTKSDITDFPAYGTTAGTICEGNDSRLSDARTPTAHTHTKSDVTDLLNSNFIPSANNSYDLGSSSYQWNNIYGNAYISKSTTAELGVTGGTTTITFQDKNGKKLAGITLGNYASSKLSYNRFSIYDKDSNNQELVESLEFAFVATNQKCYFRPSTTDKVDLGSSSSQWNNVYAKRVNTQTLNGINPGVLSLPNYDDTTYIDISGSIVPPSGETEINKNLGHNEYTPPVDGWLSIRCDGATFLQIYRNAYNCPGITSCDPSGGKLVVTLPVRKNVTYTIRIKTSGTTNIYQLYPCLGNV